MPVIHPSNSTVPSVPRQVILLNGAVYPGLYCRRITTTKQGTKASLASPVEIFAANDDPKLRTNIVIYANNQGEATGSPMFRGVIDASSKSLRDGVVTYEASSDYFWLRQRSTAIRETLAFDDGLYGTFADAGYNEFLEYNPFTPDTPTFINWSPSQILEYFATYSMEAEFQSKIIFAFDPASIVVAPYTTSEYRWELDVNGDPELVARTFFHSSLGDQVMRLTSWGQLIDYISSMMPGCQVYEHFTPTHTELWFAPPFRNGSIIASTGYNDEDWRDVGANVTDLVSNIDNAETVNRYIGTGYPANFTVTVKSNTIDPALGVVGLVPAWDLYNLEGEELVPVGIEGVANYVYEQGVYEQTTTTKQRVIEVFANPGLGDIKSAAYKPGYEHVGRRWRLPNWFSFCDIERGADMFSDPNNGNRVNAQVFIEKAVRGAEDNWQYEWMTYTAGVDFNWEQKMFSLEEIPMTYALHLNEATGKIEPWFDQGTITEGRRLCRVAVTFTYNTKHYVPYADTYHLSGGVIDPSRMTAITSGQPMVFERPDIRYHQLTNINMPLHVDFLEVYLTDPADVAANNGKSFMQIPIERQPIVYDNFIVEAFAQGKSGLQAFIDFQAASKGYNSPLVNPIVLRNDLPRLHQVVWDLYNWQGKLNRAFQLDFGWMVKAAKRGMMLQLRNIATYFNDWDAISSVIHDLEQGKTSITTTNQPGNEYDILTIGRN